MSPFPEIQTPRLRLRKIRPADLASLLRYCHNPKIADQILNIPYPYTEEDAIARMNFVLQGFKNNERLVFAISYLESDELIGEIGLHFDKAHNKAQLGYWIAEPFWGRGIASEATGALLKYGFEKLGLNKIYATHYPDNAASGKVMQKNGMLKEAEMKAHYLVEGVYRDLHQYGLTRKEYLDH